MVVNLSLGTAGGPRRRGWGSRGLKLAALAIAAPLAIVPGVAAGQPAGAVVAKSPAEVRAFWTPERMRTARPASRLLDPAAGLRGGPAAPERGAPSLVGPDAPGGPSPRSGLLEGIDSGGDAQTETRAAQVSGASTYPARTHGRVFFSIPGRGSFYCSGTVVRSPGRSMVLTAGHCVYDDSARRFATNWMFVPGYENGQRPYGEWPARRLATTPMFRSSGDLRYDAGVAIVRRNANGRGVQDRVGARGIAFNQPRNQFYRAFGYPAQSPYNGQRLYRCDSPYRGDDQRFSPPRPMRIQCDMTAGASGGGWVVDGHFVTSLTSYGYECGLLSCPERNRLFGPYFGHVVRDLYRSNRGRARRCGGAVVTHLGGRGDDVLNGTRRADVMHGRAGDDVIRGRAGDDVICGGAGDDRLVGGRGNNRIHAGPGNDRVNASARGRNRIHAVRGRNKIRCGPGRDRVVTNRITRVNRACNVVIRR